MLLMCTSKVRGTHYRLAFINSSPIKSVDPIATDEVFPRPEARGRREYVGLFLSESGHGIDDHYLLHINAFQGLEKFSYHSSEELWSLRGYGHYSLTLHGSFSN